jgi:hypothetical protein
MRDDARLLFVLEALVNQVARVAWALEAQQYNTAVHECEPCVKCGSYLVELHSAKCSACFEPKKEYHNARDREPLK